RRPHHRRVRCLPRADDAQPQHPAEPGDESAAATRSALRRLAERTSPAMRGLFVYCRSYGALQTRIVDIADRACAVEGFRMRLVQRGVLCQTLRQVRVGDEGDTERHSVSLAFSQPGVGLILGEALVGDEHTAEFLLQLRCQAIVTCLLAGADEGR